MRWGLENEWRVTDGFMTEWRFWIVPPYERRLPSTSSSALPDTPIHHLVYFAFAESLVRCEQTALDLAQIYDELTGADLAERLARSLRERQRDPRRRITHSAKLALENILESAIKSGLLKFQRHEVPWPFPDADESRDKIKEAPPDQQDWIRVLLLDSAGEPIPSDLARWSAIVDITLSGSKQYPKNSISGGRTEISSIPPGSPSACTVAFSGFHDGTDTVPVKARAARVVTADTIDPQLVRAPLEGPKLVTRRELQRTQRASLGCTNAFQLRRRSAQVVELEHFAEGAALLWPSDAPGTTRFRKNAKNRLRGIDALRACLGLAEATSLERICVTGHDAKLSQERADGVRALLVGDDDARAAWVAIANSHGIVKDQQAILAWAAGAFGWSCHPGEIDGALSPKTETAIKAFQRCYNQDIRAGRFFPGRDSLAVDGHVGPKTWGAMFDAYQRALHDGWTIPRLPAPGPKAVGCGAHHLDTPFADVDERRAVQRQVEVLFFVEGEAPEVICTSDSANPCTAASCELYDPREYTLEYAVSETRSLIVQLLDAFGQPLAAAPYELRIGSVCRSSKTDDKGLFREEHVPRAESCVLRWALPERPGSPRPDPINFDFERELFLEVVDKERDEAAKLRLRNLGYDGPRFEENLGAFQRDFELKEVPWFDSATWDELKRIHDEVYE